MKEEKNTIHLKTRINKRITKVGVNTACTKNNAGITLIALVITIIVLLILAGVSIATLTGQNEILTRTQNATEEQRGASVQEQRDLWYIEQGMYSYSGGDIKTLPEILDELEKQGLLDPDEVTEINTTGKVTIGSRTIVFKEPTIADLVKVGDYINYTVPSTSYTMTTAQTGYTSDQIYNTGNYNGKWQVLYNDVTNGVQIISSSNILVNDTSKFLYLRGQDGYNNLVSTLNTMSSYYINTTYAAEARSVGSDPSNKAGTSTYYTNDTYSYIATYAPPTMITSDTTYTTDLTAMETAGVRNISSSYWMATRRISSNSSTTNFCNYGIYNNGSFYVNSLLNVYSDGRSTDWSRNLGVRPVITLKSNIKVEDSGNTVDGKTVWNLTQYIW